MDDIIDINSFRKRDFDTKLAYCNRLGSQIAELINNHDAGIILTVLSELIGDVIENAVPFNKRTRVMEQCFNNVKRKREPHG